MGKEDHTPADQPAGSTPSSPARPVTALAHPFVGRVLASGDEGVDGWTCQDIEVVDEHSLSIRFQARERPDSLHIHVTTRPGNRRYFRQLQHCVVRYTGHLSNPSPQARAEAAVLVNGLAEMIDQRLEAAPDSTLAEALGRPRTENRRIVLDREALRQMLEPDIVLGRPLHDGWTLVEIVPASGYSGASSDKAELVLGFRRHQDERLAIQVSPRSAGRPGFAHTAHLTLIELTMGRESPPGAEFVCALVSLSLQLRDHEGVGVVVPGVGEEVTRALLLSDGPTGEEEDESTQYNLSIDADCGQACVFCSMKQVSPARDGGDATWARACSELARARERGVGTLRLNGYDPLAFSRVLDVLDFARQRGFRRVDVCSPCTRLADRAFAEAVVEAAGTEMQFLVPLYGMDPEVHDRTVGLAGAHGTLLQAIDNLVNLVGTDGVCLITVVVRGNLDQLAGIDAFADRRGFGREFHLPFPNSGSVKDPYADVVPRQSAVAEAVVAALSDGGQRLWVKGLAPCVVFPRMTACGIKPAAWLGFPDQVNVLPGTEYRSSDFAHRDELGSGSAFQAASLPCPHLRVCALAPACPGEILRAYAELFGLEDFEPLSIRDLLAAG